MVCFILFCFVIMGAALWLIKDKKELHSVLYLTGNKVVGMHENQPESVQTGISE